jgi:hypothetical protein
MFFATNPELAAIVGCCMMVILSISNGFLSVLTRMMQAIPVSAMMVYIALISLCLFSTGLLIENWVSGGPLRIIGYTGEQYLWGFGTGAINILALYFKIVAF